MDEKEETQHAQAHQHMPLMGSASTSTEDLSKNPHNDDDDNFANVWDKAKQRRQTVCMSALSFFTGVLITAILLVSTGLSSAAALHPSEPKGKLLPEIKPGTDEHTGMPAHWFNGSCGNSPAHAQSLGCVFDIVSHAWLPPDCLSDEDIVDAELMYANNTWHWGLDNMTEVALDSVRRGEFDRVWTSMDWHVTHCGYIWKRLHRAIADTEGKQKLDSYTADFHHTKHCVGMMGKLSPVEPLNATGTRVYTKYPTCSWLGNAGATKQG